jgi:hypothetical protein
LANQSLFLLVHRYLVLASRRAFTISS